MSKATPEPAQQEAKTRKAKHLPPRHEKFCQVMAQGDHSAWEAYLVAYPDALEATASTEGPALRRKPHISARISEIQHNAAERVEIELSDLIVAAHTILYAAPNEATGDHPLSELGMSKAGPYYRFPSKLDALEKIAKLKGWLKDKVEHSVTVPGLDQLLGEVVTKGLPREQKAEVK